MSKRKLNRHLKALIRARNRKIQKLEARLALVAWKTRILQEDYEELIQETGPGNMD